MTSPPAPSTDRYSIYTGGVTNWPMVAITSLLAVSLVGVMVMGGRTWEIIVPLGLTAVGILLNVLTASSVRAIAGPNGVTVRWGVLGWPRGHYPLADIQHAGTIDLSWRFVSWGYWWTPRRTCCTVQPGPTLRLTLRTGRTVTITVPNPQAAVAAIDEARRAVV
jgi:hypothetical protein